MSCYCIKGRFSQRDCRIIVGTRVDGSVLIQREEPILKHTRNYCISIPFVHRLLPTTKARTRSSFVRRHQLVRLDHLGKAFDARGICPRFRLTLLPHHASKAARPTFSWKSLDDTLDRASRNQFSVQARVVEDGGEVDYCGEGADHSRLAQILVPDDCLANAFCLCDGRVVRLEEVESYEAAGEFEGQVCGRLVCGRGSDVVEQGGEQEGFGAALPGGKVLGGNGSAYSLCVSEGGWNGIFGGTSCHSSILSWSGCTSVLEGSVQHTLGCFSPTEYPEDQCH